MSGQELVAYPIDADAKLGPAMLALAPMPRQFVLALITTGCSQAGAAQLAGYTGGPDTLKATGWRLAHDSRIQAAMHEEAQKLIRSTSVLAINVIKEIAESSWIEPQHRLKAAVELLNRSGLSAVTEHKVTVEHVQTEAEQVARIRVMATQLGLDPVKLLGNAGHVTDAEFVEVTPAYDLWTVQPEEFDRG
jgi:phage terminase small subunit